MRFPAALISTAVLAGFSSLAGVTAQAAVTPAFPARDAAIATAGDQLAAINLEIQRRSKTPMSAATIELMCDGMLRAMSAINAAPHIAPAMGQIADALNAVPGFDADMDRCQARIDFAELRHREAAARLVQAGLQDDDPLTLTLAWAQLSAGDTSAAAASAQRFATARLHQGTLLPADAALVMLIQRHRGQPPTSALQTYLAQTGDAAWPRPVLSYLAEKMSQQELLQIAASLPPGQRDLAIDDAWFAIGARLRAEGRAEEAIAALQWLTIHGVADTRTDLLARSELRLLTPQDADVRQGLAAATANPPDYAAAKAAYLKAAARGVGSAEAALGFLAQHGKGEPADAKAAVGWYQKAADHHDADGMAYLGQAYELGMGVAQDANAAARWYARAAESGHIDASFSLGKFYLGGKGGLPVDRPAALKHLYDAAQLGNTEAQAWLARLHGYGVGTPADGDLAYYWATRAANGGSLAGSLSLGVALYHGWGIAPDPDRAVELWTKASSQGSGQALLYLSTASTEGRGTPKRWEAGFRLFLEGMRLSGRDTLLDMASLGDPDYVMRVAAILNEGGKADESAQLILTCARRDVARCQNSIGVDLQYTATPNLAQAAEWYRKAADQGYPQSLNNLADMYEKGLAVEIDIPRAIRMYRQAARQGYAFSLFSLGELNEQGKGMPADPYLAYLYYELASNAKQEDAPAGRSRVAKQLTGAQIGQARAAAAAWKAPQPLPDGLNDDGTGTR